MLSVLFLALFFSSGQGTNTPESKMVQVTTNDPFEAVPPDTRAAVKTSVDLIVKLEKERQWGKIYDLARQDQPPMAREKFILDASHEWTLIEFVPTGAQQRFGKDADWIVNGCALVDVHGRKESWEIFIKIKLTDPNKRVLLLLPLKKRGGIMRCLQPPPKEG